MQPLVCIPRLKTTNFLWWSLWITNTTSMRYWNKYTRPRISRIMFFPDSCKWSVLIRNTIYANGDKHFFVLVIPGLLGLLSISNGVQIRPHDKTCLMNSAEEGTKKVIVRSWAYGRNGLYIWGCQPWLNYKIGVLFKEFWEDRYNLCFDHGWRVQRNVYLHWRRWCSWLIQITCMNQERT